VALSRFCLDTSAYSLFKRGDGKVVELLDAAEWVGVPSIVLGELWVGFLSGQHRDRNEAELDRFLANPVVEELAIDHDVARLYAEILLALKRAGTPLPGNDIWVAACAARHGATVLTYDRHFSTMTRVGSLILETPGD
jgi:tRNA(fMet)-specific endonuclease VapC